MKGDKDKITLYVIVGAIALIVIIISALVYNHNVKDSQDGEVIDYSVSEQNNEEAESASTEIGNTVEESENALKEENTTINSTKANNTTTNSTGTKSTSNTVSNSTESTETVKELSFAMPVEGEIIREFASDSLVYSETLDEWITHNGIDIKADNTTVVKAAEAGIVKSIKNDPRYGLTIVIEHDDTYQTVYSNLLSSEFVVEGETVEKGQSIGTVGNSAAFEISDESHLHFEIWKDSVAIDPTLEIE